MTSLARPLAFYAPRISRLSLHSKQLTIGLRPCLKTARFSATDARASSPTPSSTSKPPAATASPIIGIGAAAVTATAGFTIAHELGMGLLKAQGVAITAATASPVSGVPVAILLGIGMNALLGQSSSSSGKAIRAALKPGLALSTKAVLQSGIVCVGLKLSLWDIYAAGTVGIPAVLAAVGAGMLFVPWFGRQMGLSGNMSTLIAAGTSICGVTAIMAVSPVVKATDKESSFAVANVVAFGTLGMLLHPYLAHWAFNYSQAIGTFLGLAVHDTSQVIGAALTYVGVFGDETVLKAAAVTKLTRNLCLAGVVPYLAVLHAKTSSVAASGAAPASTPSSFSFSGLLASARKHTPTFVYFFLGAAVLRTLGDYSVASPFFSSRAFGILPPDLWTSFVKFTGDTLGSKLLLGTAMAAVGLGTDAASLKGVGIRPFVVGFAAAVVVGGTGFCCAWLIEKFAS